MYLLSDFYTISSKSTWSLRPARAGTSVVRPFETVTFTAALPFGYLAPEAGDLPGVGPPALRTSDRVLCAFRRYFPLLFGVRNALVWTTEYQNLFYPS